MNYDLIVIGAGAAGCFAAIRLAEKNPGAKICILEAARKPLSKVEISGGGRCNVTHACFDANKLIENYPRGGDVLLNPFRQFGPRDLVNWFESKHVKLKAENDGRMFPVTDKSATIINCFLAQMNRSGIELHTSTRAIKWEYLDDAKKWNVQLFDGRKLSSKVLLLTTGSDTRTWDTLKEYGHTIIAPVPSLFTFNIQDKNLQALMGLSKIFVHISIPQLTLNAAGPLLITHWGLSGPAILRLSAWGARKLNDVGYVFDLRVNWSGNENANEFMSYLQSLINENPKRFIHNITIKDIPARLWKYFCIRAEIPEFMSGSEFGKKQIKCMREVLTEDLYRVTGKSTFKEEFVTAGGVDLNDINMETFESRKHPHLYMAGEVLNIDAITGGFNFQAAWTAADLAAGAIARSLR